MKNIIPLHEYIFTNDETTSHHTHEYIPHKGSRLIDREVYSCIRHLSCIHEYVHETFDIGASDTPRIDYSGEVSKMSWNILLHRSNDWSHTLCEEDYLFRVSWNRMIFSDNVISSNIHRNQNPMFLCKTCRDLWLWCFVWVEFCEARLCRSSWDIGHRFQKSTERLVWYS